MSEIEVDEHSGMVVINIADHGRDGDCEGGRHTPEAVRALAAEMLAAADRAEPFFAEQRALCEVEHEWGLPWNSAEAFERVTVRLCLRETCHARDVVPGWLPFEARAHRRPCGPATDCTGPGCDACDAEELGKSIRLLLEKAYRDLQPPVLGSAFDKAKMTVEVHS